MLENAGAKKQGLNPGRIQLRDRSKVRTKHVTVDQRHRGRMMSVPGGDKSHNAMVIEPICIGMDLFVQTRRNAQQRRPDQNGQGGDSNEGIRAFRRARRAFSIHDAASF